MCLQPYQWRDKVTGEIQSAPCQKCPECRWIISKHMANRIRLECSNNDYNAWFITGTIAPEYYVYTPEEYKNELQRMIKRMRKAKENIKYILSIEKGDKTKRLHHHIILLSKHKAVIDVYNFYKDYYVLGFIEAQKARLRDIHYVVSYIYDGVVFRQYSKGIGKPNQEQLEKIKSMKYDDIPTYYRRLVERLYPEDYLKMKLEYLNSDRYRELKTMTKDQEKINKKIDKYSQLVYALKNYSGVELVKLKSGKKEIIIDLNDYI